uniref:SET domain-containing protein n=1 Tax=Corethron hystrix TaxID=216773 RepID=A0A6U5LM47_9STRA|mmetsp:Transcript_6175/g.13344  ORF Transcript_6175/g.13344 Transcript_6175/m.13344 type:complete len:174 (+) Transcript_6175:71-592(+)
MPHISCTTRPMLLLSLYYILAYAALPTNTFVLNDAHRHIHNYSTIDTRTSDKILSLFSPRSWKQLQLFHLGRHARLMNSSSSASSVESHSSKFPELIELMTNELAKMNMLMSRDVFAVSVRENSSSLKQLYSQIVKNVEIRESSISDAGLGLFATKNIKAGSIVSFYPAHVGA